MINNLLSNINIFFFISLHFVVVKNEGGGGLHTFRQYGETVFKINLHKMYRAGSNTGPDLS